MPMQRFISNWHDTRIIRFVQAASIFVKSVHHKVHSKISITTRFLSLPGAGERIFPPAGRLFHLRRSPGPQPPWPLWPPRSGCWNRRFQWH